VNARSTEGGFRGDEADKKAALETTCYVLAELAKAIAPFMPFIAEDIYKRAGSDKESVHLESWPEPFDISKGSEKILVEMEEVRKTVSLGLEARAKAGVKVRQPLASLTVKKDKKGSDNELDDLIKDEMNVKEIIYNENIENEVEIDTELTLELEREGQMRELVRYIQELRKKADLKPSNTIDVTIEGGEDILKVKELQQQIKKNALIKNLVQASIVGDDNKFMLGGGVQVKVRIEK